MQTTTTTRLTLSERARTLLVSTLDKASADIVLDIAELQDRRAGPGVLALMHDTLSALADAREQLTVTTVNHERVA